MGSQLSHTTKIMNVLSRRKNRTFDLFLVSKGLNSYTMVVDLRLVSLKKFSIHICISIVAPGVPMTQVNAQ